MLSTEFAVGFFVYSICTFKTVVVAHDTNINHSLLYNVDRNANFTCLNGGSVIQGKCRCNERFEGDHCQFQPCLNGGRRIKGSSPTKCHCPFGLKGNRCEKVTHCIEGKGKLVDGKCECESRWSGLFCHARSCYNGVTIGAGDATFCLCDIGYTGPFCETHIVCVHGAINSENRCVCIKGWTGEDCSVCAAEYDYVDGNCKLIEIEHPIDLRDHKSIIRWPMVIVGFGAVFLTAFIILTFVYFLKYYNSKSSVPSSESGTDV